MKQNYFFKFFFAILFVLTSTASWSQTTIISEDFETDGDGIRYTISNEFNDGSNDHFGRTDGSNVSGGYSGQNGSFFIAGEDLDDGGGDGSAEKTILLNVIDITGYSDLKIKVLAAAGSAATSGWDSSDYLRIEYSTDGTNFITGLQFSAPVSGSNKGINFDTNNDGIGDGSALTNIFTEFQQNIPVTGSTLYLRLYAKANSANEEFAIDYIRLEGTTSSGNPAPQITNISNLPIAPTSSNSVIVSAEITDADGIASATINWGTTSGSLTNTVAMSNIGGSTAYEGTIPAQIDGTTVFYTVEATDSNASPETTTSSEQSYNVLDSSENNLVTTIDFETENDGYTLSGSEGNSFTDVFNRIDSSNKTLGGNNTFLFAIEDTNLNDPSIQVNQIDVTNTASFTFSIDMLAHHYDDWDNSDELLITYSIDGGTYQNLMWVQNTGDVFNAPAALDLGFDGNGDCGSETTLPALTTGTSDNCTVSSNQFATFITNAINLNNNSTLDIKLQFNGFEAGDEGLYLDNIIITETPASSDPTITFNESSSVFAETNTTFATSGIEVTLTNYDADVTVTAAINESSTAEAGDYSIDLTPLVFDANETLNIPLSINPDADFDDETIIIDITVTSGTADIITSQHIVTITDDDLPEIFISEIMYNSRGTDDEWIELYNGNGTDVDISSYTLEYNNLTFTFPSSSIFSSESYIVIAVGSNGDGTFNNDNPFQPDYNNLSVTNTDVAIINITNKLTNTSRTIELKNTKDVTIDSVTYSSSDGANENGSTFELIDSSADNSLTSSNWQESGVLGGSPKSIGSSVWTGSISTDWSASANWKSPIGPPTTTSNIVIPNGLGRYPTVSNAVITNKVFIESGATLIAESTFTGSVTYERNLGTTNWYLVSSPVSGESYDNEWVNSSNIDDTNGTGEGTNKNIGIATYETNSDSWSYVKSGSSGDFLSGIGYSVKQNFSSNLYFTGSINTDDLGVDVVLSTEGNRFNALGNPYTSYINSTTFLNNESSISESKNLWVWNQSLGISGSYEVKDASDEFMIAPSQGFFVKANAAGGTFNFDEDNQSDNNGTDTFQKNSSTVIKLWIDNEDGLKNYGRIKYLENATKGYDVGLDGEMLDSQNQSFAIYSHLLENNNDKKYQLQSLPNRDFETMVVPIGVIADANKEIIFTAEITNLPDGLEVFIEDREQNIFTRLDEENSSYEVFLDENLRDVGRFYLHTTNGALSTIDNALKGVSIFATDKNTLRISGINSTDASITVFNILGEKLVKSSFTSKGITDIRLPNLASGVYIIQLATEKGTTTKKIILD